jgi:DNA-binding PadR family transcriptional regulator
MPIQHAVLALLGSGHAHGYQLKNDFEAAIGPQWGPLNIGHLYQVLERLSRDGMVTSTRVAQEIKPDRVVYEITDVGRAELARWLDEPTPRTGGYRDDFFLKVMSAANTGDAKIVTRVVANQRAFLMRELRNLETLRGQPRDDTVVTLLLTAAARHVSADLAFLDDVEQTLLLDGGKTIRALAAARSQPSPAKPAAEGRRAG